MSAEAAGAAALVTPPQALQTQDVQAGYGASLGQSVQFSDALHAASAGGGITTGGVQGATPTGGLDALQPAVRGMMSTLESVNGEASQLAQAASAAKAKGADMTPGDMVMLSVRCQEFMFHCQLTSNIANRTSDGLQQLFRQQG